MRYPAADHVSALEWMGLVGILAVAAGVGVLLFWGAIALVRLLFR